MNKILLIYKKELTEFFTTPLVYIITTLFSIIIGYLFFNYMASSQDLTDVNIINLIIYPLFGNINLILLLLSPLLSMKLFSEEKRDGTLNLLLISNLKIVHIILGKFLAILSIIILLILLCGVVPLTFSLVHYHNSGLFIANFVGLLLCTSAYLSISIFCSTLTENQMIASFFSYVIILFLIFLLYAGNPLSNVLLKEMIQYTSISFHFEYFGSGAISSYSVIYFLSLDFFFLFLSYLSLERRRW